jgi:hypothetical protein
MKRMGLIIAVFGLFLFAPAARADWSAARRLTWTAGESCYPAIAIDSNNTLHVVWHDNSDGNFEIYYKRSFNGGATWSPNQRLTWTSGSSMRPAIAIDSYNMIHLVWEDNTPGGTEIYYKGSTDGGTTWQTAQRLTWTPGESIFPAIGIGPGNSVHIVWQDPAPAYDEIYYRRSIDEGVSWGPVKRLTWTSHASFFPDIAVSSGYLVQAVWTDFTPGNAETYFKGSADGGATWTPIKRLTWTTSSSFTPAIAIDSNATTHVVWRDYATGNDELYYKRSADGGATWTPIKRLTWTTSDSYYPAMAIDSSNNIHIVCYNTAPGNDEIYYKRSTDGGDTWSALQRLTWNSGYSNCPAIDVDSNLNVHIVWHDDTPGNYEIYYKKGK